MSPKRAGSKAAPAGASLFALLKPYRRLVAILVVLTIAGNGLTLVVPKLISHAIDAYTQRTFVLSAVVLQFSVIAFLVFALNYVQNIIQTYASERVARDLRTDARARFDTAYQQVRVSEETLRRSLLDARRASPERTAEAQARLASDYEAYADAVAAAEATAHGSVSAGGNLNR